MTNRGEKGPGSLRINGERVSDLPWATQEQVKQDIPAFLEEQRRLKVDRIIARYPRGSVAFYETRILECQSNQKRFAALKEDCMRDIGNYMELMRNRAGDLTQDEVNEMAAEVVGGWIEENKANPEWVKDGVQPISGTLGFRQLLAKLDPINARLRLYEDEALWVQVGLFQESRDKYDLAVKTEAESIINLKEAIMMVHQRDREITAALTEPLSVG